MYVFAIFTSLLLPRFVNRYLTNLMSQPFTLAFSNTPGILRPVEIGDAKIYKVKNALVDGGRLGICISCLSYSGAIRITVLADTAILSHDGVQTILKYMEEAIQQLDKMKSE